MKVRFVLVGVAALALAGCGSAVPTVSESEVSSSKEAAMASIKGAIEQQLGTTTEAPVVFPSPDASQSATLLSALGAIDPGLNRDRSIDRSRNSCKDIKDGMPHAQVVSRTKQRFEGGTVPSLSDQQVEQIVVAITTSFCR